jgi:hypothetical protein
VGVSWLRKERIRTAERSRLQCAGCCDREVDRHIQAPALVPGARQLLCPLLSLHRYPLLRCKPFPVQKSHPPIWVGRHSRTALRRTARHSDSWHPVVAVAASPLPPQEMRAYPETLNS